MKTADLYYNVNGDSKEIIISGEYPGGTWRISFADNKSGGIWTLHQMVAHTRGFLYVGESTGIVEVLKMAEKLNNES